MNAAGFHAALAPNTIVTIFGRNLSPITYAVTAADIRGEQLPTRLPGAGVQVSVAGLPAPLLYVSPTQINFLWPNVRSGLVPVYVANGHYEGPTLQVPSLAAAPALFQVRPGETVAQRADGSPATASHPLLPGDVAVLWATGLGPVRPALAAGQVPGNARPLAPPDELQITLAGQPVPGDAILYAGTAPGFAGLYQINLRIPPGTPAQPEIRLRRNGVESPPGVTIPVR